MRHATGDLPDPSLALAFTIWNNKAYLLTTTHDTNLTLEVYQLDLDTWEWSFVLTRGKSPTMMRDGVVAKTKWLDMSAVQMKVKLCLCSHIFARSISQ